jgi:hypothetical protein
VVAGQDILANSRIGAKRNAEDKKLLNKILFKDYIKALSLYSLINISIPDKVSRRMLG